MATPEEVDEARDAVGEIGKPNSQSSVHSEAVTKKAGEEREASNEDDEREGKGEEESEGEEEEDGEEYEIEQILESKRGMFKKGELAYLVKWKGYSPEQNSWVSEADAENAVDLINEFLMEKAKAKEQSSRRAGRGRKPNSAKISKSTMAATPDTESVSASTAKRGRGKAASPSDSGEDEQPRKTKKARSGANANGSTGTKRTLASLNRTDDEDAAMVDVNGADDEGRSYTTMKNLKLGSLKNWEDIVKVITTIERDKNDLLIYFETTDGKFVREPSSVCKKKFPQKLIEFYESHLRWKTPNDVVSD